jgi:hypothetical protein
VLHKNTPKFIPHHIRAPVHLIGYHTPRRHGLLAPLRTLLGLLHNDPEKGMEQEELAQEAQDTGADRVRVCALSRNAETHTIQSIRLWCVTGGCKLLKRLQARYHLVSDVGQRQQGALCLLAKSILLYSIAVLSGKWRNNRDK